MSYTVHPCRVRCVPDNYFRVTNGPKLIAIYTFRGDVQEALRAAYDDAVAHADRLIEAAQGDWRYSPLNPAHNKPAYIVRPARFIARMNAIRFPRLYR